MEMLEYDELQQLLDRLGITQEASEYHGALCGMLCHGDLQAQSLVFDEMKPDMNGREALKGFTQASLENLELPEFMPLLPEDDQQLFDRVEALATWCGGFLYGLGVSKALDIKKLSDESQELVQDFTEISRAGIGAADDAGEEEERAYMELVEYVRVGAQVIFLEVHPHGDSSSTSPPFSGNSTVH